MSDEVLDVAFCAREKIIDANDVASTCDQAFAEV
jgi:hypothetical protein